jgi:hypothetical protein
LSGAAANIEQSRLKVKSPQTDRSDEWLRTTLRAEFCHLRFCRKVFTNLDEWPTALNEWGAFMRSAGMRGGEVLSKPRCAPSSTSCRWHKSREKLRRGSDMGISAILP